MSETTPTPTRAERKALNRRAHAIRRALTNADYAQAKADGQAVTWAQIAAVYDAMSAADVVATFGDDATPAPAAPAAPAKPKRQAPAHVREAAEAYRLARESWEAGLEAAMRGASRDGKPARGEDPRYTDEERDYRAAHPAPVYKTFLTDAAAARRAANGDA